MDILGPKSNLVICICLVDVAEGGILLIRESSPLDLVNHILVDGPLGLIPATVLPLIVNEKRNRQHSRSSLGGKDSNFGGPIIWRISRLECLWADDISNGEGACDQSTGERTLGVTSAVRHRPLVKNGQGGHNCVDQVDANQNACLVAFRHERQEGPTNDARDSTKGIPCPAVRGLPNTKANEQREEDTDNAGRHIQKSRDRTSETESSNQSGRVGGHNTT